MTAPNVAEPNIRKTPADRRIARAGAPRLFYRLYEPTVPVRGSVLVAHGYAEHMGRYEEVAEAWSARGLVVATFDLRGHGRSGGARGHVDRFEDYLRDVQDVLASLETDERWRNAGRPVIFGHSMGGLIACHFVLRSAERFSGLALSSPFIGLGIRLHPVQRLVAPVASRLVPWLRQPSGLKGDDLTHDRERAARYDSDPFHFDHVTVRWVDEMTRAQERLMHAAWSITLRAFCLAAGDDRVVSLEATRRLFQRLGSEQKELRVLDGKFHEILNEVDRREHIGAFADQMLRWFS